MESFEEIYRQYYKRVYYQLLKISGNPDVAEEVTQESFFKVMKKLDTFREESSLNTWIMEIAQNTYISYCRKHKPEAELPENMELSGKRFETELVERDTAMQIHKVLHLLPDPYREVFWMRTFGELSFREIGEVFGKSENWARVTCYRARVMIKEELKI